MAIPNEFRLQRLLLPSLLSADFSRLGVEVERLLDVGVHCFHLDVMDGRFVPNITVGPIVLEHLAPKIHARGAFVDVHFMLERPDLYVDDFARAGADAISVHMEATPHIHRTLTAIRALGLTPGVAINPGSDISLLGEAALYVDYVLVMSVNPGFSGQQFIPESINKIRRLRRLLPEDVLIEVDGGVGSDNIPHLGEAGASWFVAGSAVFGADNPAAEAQRLQTLASEGRAGVVGHGLA